MRTARLPLLLLGLALLLVGPALLAIPAYRASTRVADTLPGLERELGGALASLEAGPLRCGLEQSGGGPSPGDLQQVWSRLASAAHRTATAGVSPDDEGLYWAVKRRYPGMQGLWLSYAVARDVTLYVSDRRNEPSPCQPGPGGGADAPRWVAERRGDLGRLRSQAAEARDAVAGAAALLAPAAWGLGLLELAGLVQMVRTLARARASRGKGGAGPDGGGG